MILMRVISIPISFPKLLLRAIKAKEVGREIILNRLKAFNRYETRTGRLLAGAYATRRPVRGLGNHWSGVDKMVLIRTTFFHQMIRFQRFRHYLVYQV